MHFVAGGHGQGIAKSGSLKHLSVEHSVIGDDLVEGMLSKILFYSSKFKLPH